MIYDMTDMVSGKEQEENGSRKVFGGMLEELL